MFGNEKNRTVGSVKNIASYLLATDGMKEIRAMLNDRVVEQIIDLYLLNSSKTGFVITDPLSRENLVLVGQIGRETGFNTSLVLYVFKAIRAAYVKGGIDLKYYNPTGDKIQEKQLENAGIESSSDSTSVNEILSQANKTIKTIAVVGGVIGIGYALSQVNALKGS